MMPATLGRSSSSSLLFPPFELFDSRWRWLGFLRLDQARRIRCDVD
jgi:hypothetical protein